MDCSLQLLVGVAIHLVTTYAELLGVGHLKRRVETTPKDDPGYKAAEGQKTEAVVHTGLAQQIPVELQPFHHQRSPLLEARITSSTALKSDSTSGWASVCGTWHWVQK